jgi:hypothetical protein
LAAWPQTPGLSRTVSNSRASLRILIDCRARLDHRVASSLESCLAGGDRSFETKKGERRHLRPPEKKISFPFDELSATAATPSGVSVEAGVEVVVISVVAMAPRGVAVIDATGHQFAGAAGRHGDGLNFRLGLDDRLNLAHGFDDRRNLCLRLDDRVAVLDRCIARRSPTPVMAEVVVIAIMEVTAFVVMTVVVGREVAVATVSRMT